METDPIPSAGEPPLASICGIQFGLMTTDEMYKLSVNPANNPLTKTKELYDPKLGHPIVNGPCSTCNGETVDQCQGHFAHCHLPSPIYHPHHVGKLVRLLKKICLNCGQPKRKKKAGKLTSLLAPGLKTQLERNATLTPIVEEENIWVLKNVPRRPRTSRRQVVDDDNNDDEDDGHCSLSLKYKKRKLGKVYMDTEARVNEQSAEESQTCILLSSDDEEDFSSSSRMQLEVQRDGDNDEKDPETPNSPARGTVRKKKNPLSVAQRRKRKRVENDNDSQPHGGSVAGMCQVKPAEETSKVNPGKCKYCSGARPDRYPEVHLKMELRGTGGGKEKNSSKGIKMEYKPKKSVAPDYWSFVAGKSPKNVSSSKTSRPLLPSQALEILRKIPESAMINLGMHPKVARPEALILECVPVPPNCTRIRKEFFDWTNQSSRQESDLATGIFNRLLNKINAINKSRFGTASFEAASVEVSELQYLFGLYLREKGAPKAVPGKEKKTIDRSGRVQKKDRRWSWNWLKENVLGKIGSFSARDVVTGDPYLRVEEIGIPQQIAKHVTIPERVNKLNMETLQEYVNNGQSLFGRYRACGAVRLVRGSERLEVTRRTSHELQIGDIVHRHLRDGDLVCVNRNPSLDKHSLLALRVHIHDLAVFSIHPSVCAPLCGDFDGDCLHVFFPQSEEAKAEQHLLMTIPEQLLPSPDGNTILSMSQDNILATHLLTANPVFLNKEEMYQVAMWSTRRLPIPAIVKSVRGPMWAGKQVIDLTIPEGFSITSNDGAVNIRDGELVSYNRKENWLTNTNGLMRALAQHNPIVAVNHLDCSQSVLREWLLSRGFSVSLEDFYAAPDQKSRRKMIGELMDDVNYSENMAFNKELIFYEKFQKLNAIQSDVDMGSTKDLKYPEVLEDIAVAFFQQQFREIGGEFVSKVSDDNQLLSMLRSGSKGSLARVFQQIGCLGLQLDKGGHLPNTTGDAKLISLASCEARWHSLVRSSLLDGLNPVEFYHHAIAMRADMFRKCAEKPEPGEMFKNLMLFLRDTHVSYDGTVRMKCGLEIIQFSYDGARNSESSDIDTTEGKESVMPGEPVGVLAATAIAKPAYLVMLEAGHSVGAKKIRPWTLLKDTIYPRSATKLKASDRCTLLRLKPCPCKVHFCEERRALNIQNQLLPVSVEMVAKAVSIQYAPEGSQCIADGVKLRLPWVGHIQFDKKALIQMNLEMERVVSILEIAFMTKSYAKIMANNYLINPIFFSRTGCDCRGARISNESGPCLHFSASLKSRTTRRMVARSNKKVLEFLDALRDVMMPLILQTTVKGDERIDSAKLVWEDAAWSPCRLSDDGERIPANSKKELVVEVVVQEMLSTNRGSPWSIMKEACALIDTIDWKRSSPYSIQEIRHSLGVEAARDCILQRLGLATQAGGSSVSNTHLKLVSDLMVHSGDVNGINSFGYKDLLRSLKKSAPFTAGALRGPMKTFMEAGEQGDEEFLSGILASSILGKRVPVGTGTDFSLQLKPKEVILDNMQLPMQSMDIFDRLANLKTKIKEEFPETRGAVGKAHVDGDTNEAYGNGAWGASPTDAGDWGNGTEAVARKSDPEGGGSGGSQSPGQANGSYGGWDAPNACDKGGWASPAPAENLPSSGAWDAVDGQNQETVPVAHGQATVEAMHWQGSDIGTDNEHTVHVALDAVEANPAASDGWGEPLPDEPLPDAWCGVTEEMTKGSSGHLSRKDEPREFKPTGANTVPLGKIRHFGPKIVGAGSDSVNASPVSMPLDFPVPGTVSNGGTGGEISEPGWEDQEEKLESNRPGSISAPDWGGEEAVSDGWALTVGQEGGTSSGSLDRPTRSETTPRWPLLVDGTGHNGLGRARRLDDRKDSKDWEEIVETVRFVKNILQTYEPEQRLNDEVHQVLMTQVLMHHPSSATKVGCGVDYFKVAYYKTSNPNERPTKCLFLVRTDGTQDDFSYHKCLKTLASNKNPRLDDLYVIAFTSRK